MSKAAEIAQQLHHLPQAARRFLKLITGSKIFVFAELVAGFAWGR